MQNYQPSEGGGKAAVRNWSASDGMGQYWTFVIRPVSPEDWVLNVTRAQSGGKRISRMFTFESDARDEAEMLMDVFGLRVAATC